MLSKSQISFVKSLHQKKNRKDNGLFIVEGIKSVIEFTQSNYLIDTIFCTAQVMPKLVNFSQKIKLYQVTEAELTKISTLTTPQDVLALVQIPQQTFINTKLFENSFTLVLDDIQDPGNLGTIIRTADWFGFQHIICSTNTVEVYNPKVVQASMGSLSRIKINYTHLPDFLKIVKAPIYGALLNGKSIYETEFKTGGILVLGNEGNGITTDVLPHIEHQVTIPRYGHAESLNVAVSAAIFCSEIKRKHK
ncbi:MAG: TrmH family RNA methyltransferase [Daejeonella sp.]